MRFRRPPKGTVIGAVVDLTPLIDVVFLLLIFFLLTAAPAPDPTMAVRLPEASHGEVVTTPREVTLFLGRDGRLRLGSREVRVGELANLLKSLKKKQDISRVVLKGDTQAQYGMVVRILDAVTDAGLPLGIAVSRDGKSGDENSGH